MNRTISTQELVFIAQEVLRRLDLSPRMASSLVFDWRSLSLLALLVNAAAKAEQDAAAQERLNEWKEIVVAEILSIDTAQWWTRPHAHAHHDTDPYNQIVMIETGDPDIGQLAFHVNPKARRISRWINQPTLGDIGRRWDGVRKLPMARDIALRWWGDEDAL